jgi:hypothetical protein
LYRGAGRSIGNDGEIGVSWPTGRRDGRPLPLLDGDGLIGEGLLVTHRFRGPSVLTFRAPSEGAAHVVLSVDTRPLGGTVVERMLIPRSEFRQTSR